MMGVPTLPDRKTPTCSTLLVAVGFAPPNVTVFCGLDSLGLVVSGQRLEPDRAELACRVVTGDRWVPALRGCEGAVRDSVVRRLVREPFGWRPTTLVVTLRRYACEACGHVWRQDMTAPAEPRARLPRRALAWALEALVVGHPSVARVAAGLGVSWNTANDAVWPRAAGCSSRTRPASRGCGCSAWMSMCGATPEPATGR